MALCLLAGCSSSPKIGGAGTEELELPMPAPARGRLERAVRENAECEGCHEEIAREWRSSLHRRADVEPAYRRAFAIEPMPFCRACHAPEALPDEPEPASVAELGVGCVSCHVTGPEGVLAAPRSGHAPPAPHAVYRDARFARADACASCHEFAFPVARARGEAGLMQATISEHRGSPARDKPCADCHMPVGASGKRSHAFIGSRDADFVRSALSAAAKRLSPTRVELTLIPTGAGHAVPTGDLFRRLEVAVEAVGPDNMVLSKAERFLTRHFVLDPGKAGRRLVSDDRLRSETMTIELDLGAEGEGRTIAWYVAYQRVAHPKGVDEREAEVEGEIIVASGHLCTEPEILHERELNLSTGEVEKP